MALHMGSGITSVEARVGPWPAAPQAFTINDESLPTIGTARIYVCGITPYDVTHLGHASTFVWADALAAVLGNEGVATHVSRNITDVDDVLFDAARAQGSHYDEFATIQQGRFDRAMRELRVAAPVSEPRARHYIDAGIQLTQALLDVGAAYERDGAVWFRGADVPGNSGIEREQALSRAREYGDRPDDPNKDDPFDVELWRPSAEGEPAWPSPWGWGRPGWHAECAAMALAVHGAAVDVLVGGEDLAFPHHAYQAAMVSAATGVRPFARATLHVGEVRINGEKMAKSSGNLVLVDEVLQVCTPAALRLFLLNRPVSEPWDYREADVVAAEAQLQRLYAAAARPAADADPQPALAALRANLDVATALQRAEAGGGEAARQVLRVLRLS